MPSKLRKVIGAVKDQTSISLAKATNSSNVDVAVLKATTHDDVPLDERYVNEVLVLTSSNKVMAAACAQAIARRIGRTRNWIVALKTLMLVLRIFQDGDPYFPREVLHAMKRGSRILNLSSFRDDKNSSPWDYTAFVRTYSLYLDERLNCFLLGKLQRRAVVRERENNKRINRAATKKFNEHVRDMKPAMLIDKISYWQRLLDRAIATRPTGAAKNNTLVQVSLYAVVTESFDLYRDISDGLALLLDSFFHLKYQSCCDAFKACVKASKQYEELCSFYTLCKSIGVGRVSEYPSVQKIADELLETLQEFLKDQSSFPNGNGTRSSPLQPPQFLGEPSNNEETGASPVQNEASEGLDQERDSDMGSELHTTHQRAYSSLEDLLSVTDAGTSPSISFHDHERNSEQWEKQTQEEDLGSNWNMDGSISRSMSMEQRNSSSVDFGLVFDDQTQVEASVSGCSPEMSRDGWELELAECASNISSTPPSQNVAPRTGFDSSLLDELYNPAAVHHHHHHQHNNLSYSNPFLSSSTNDLIGFTNNPNNLEVMSTPTSPLAMCNSVFDPFSSLVPTFQAKPTFSAQNPNDSENDPFATTTPSSAIDQATMNRQNLLLEQQMWLQNQNKIIAKNIA
ncbi:clathrin coat assembly protein AP180-like [Papaver somniferum]|uniref:clathrin coat assembly protein AP180-like n=1 Tax=Papaver somniferum TaxID=3469 RepID=UPI000E6F6A20|nr:clathrin coat assembly protein AP180-like [Papaver somniferum]